MKDQTDKKSVVVCVLCFLSLMTVPVLDSGISLQDEWSLAKVLWYALWQRIRAYFS